MKDTDCKGTRICVIGVCTDVPPPPDMTIPALDFAVIMPPTVDFAIPPIVDLAVPPVLDFAVPPRPMDLATHDLWRCTIDAQCSGATPRCDSTAGQCVACLPANDNCASGTYCASGASGYACVNGCKTVADCPSFGAQGCCNHQCTNLHVDNSNCGACGTACAGGNSCCGATCINTAGTDVNNCGACGVACQPTLNATPGCAGGKCVVASCAGGTGDCNHTYSDGCETDITSDPSNCGVCGMACPQSPAYCGNGTCQQGYLHHDGEGETWVDTVPTGTHTQGQATAACVAYHKVHTGGICGFAGDCANNPAAALMENGGARDLYIGWYYSGPLQGQENTFCCNCAGKPWD